jgi:iron complex outermembrane receptor protein
MAQGASADEGNAIIVTARRVEERLQDVPISITVFSPQQINNRNIINAADLGTFTPSLSTNSKFGSEKASFAIRGFVQDLATQPSVGVYFADVVAPRSGGSTTSGNGVGIGNLFDLQNVQVLKGPQGTLQGRNTTGGAVLIVPQKPTGKFEGYVEGSLGNYDMRRIQAVINVPVGDTFRMRVGVDRATREGYLINHSGIGPDRLGNMNYWAVRFSAVADLTPDLENYFIATYNNSDNNGIAGRVVACNPANALGGSLGCAQLARQNARGDGMWDVENSEPFPKLEMTTWQAINTTTWHASDNLTVKNIASYSEFRETTRYSLEGENFLVPGTPQGSNPFLTLIRLNNTPGYNNSIQSTFTEELQFQGRALDDKLIWQAGGYMEQSNPLGFTSQATTQLLNCPNSYSQLANVTAGTGSITCPTFPPGGSISVPFQKTWFRDYGLYAQATYNFTDKLALTGGFRYTWDKMTHRYDGVSIGFPVAGGGVARYTCPNVVRLTPGSNAAIVIPSLSQHDVCNVTFATSSDKPTWLIDLDYKPNQDVMLYAKWARGYRAGGVASANILYETWQPESVDLYEVGAKTSFNSFVRGYLNVAGFYNNFRNQQIQATLVRSATSPLIGGSAIVNAGKSRIWGFEVDTSVQLFEGFRVDGGYTYLNTKVQEINVPPLTPDLAPFYSAIIPTAGVGQPLPLSPRNRFTITGTYTLPIDQSVGKISFGATWVHTDSQYASRADDNFVGLIGYNPGRMPATDLLNINVSWNDVAGKPIDLSFFATNVTQEAFPVNVNNAFQSFGIESQIVNEPRMYGFRLKYRFGR